MSFLSWNCRGLVNPCTILELKDLVQQKKPNLIFLQDTKVNKTKLQQLCDNLVFEGLNVVNPEGQSGGLALLWKDKHMCSVINSQKYFIDVEVHIGGIPDFRYTGFYGCPVTN